MGIGFCAFGAWGKTLRIVSYNIDCADQSSDNNLTGSTHSLPTVVQGIGLHHIGTNAQPMDVMSCEELTSTTLANFVAQLNAIYGTGTYAYDPTTDPSTGGGPDGLIYNTLTIQVVSARALLTGQNVLLQSNGTYTAANSPGGGVNGVPRAPMVYQLRPVGYTSNADFYMYVSHARSSSDNPTGDARYAEAQEIRSDEKYNLPAGSHILVAGDWNLFSGSGENAYKCLTGQTTSDGINWSDTSSIWANTNQTQGYDPMSKTTPPTTVTWGNVAGDNATYLYGDSTASLTSRIDIQLPNALMFAAYNANGGVQLAPDTSDPYDSANFPSSKYPYAFETFGNNGSLPRSSTTTSSSNHSLDDLTNTVPNDATVYTDIVLTGSGATFTGSDHYPLVGDYNVVAASSAALAVTPATAFNSSGAGGGAFSPSSQTYTLTNASASSLSWTATNTASWLTLSARSGTLAAGASTTVTASITANANSLAAGTYTDTIAFTNLNNSADNTTRAASLTVTNNAPVITSLSPSGTVAKNAGDTASFTVSATGSSLNYQWMQGNINLASDGSHIFGAQSSSLTISNLAAADAGSYSVTVTNTFGSATTNLILTVATNDTSLGIRLTTLPTTFIYTQSFDSLPTTATGYSWTNNGTIKGWYADKTGGATGYFTNVDNGSSANNGLHDYGASASTDRSLGVTADSGGTYWANVAFGARFTNDTSVVVSNMTISFTGKQWRQTTSSNILQFFYRTTGVSTTNVDAASNFVWTAVGSLNFTNLKTGTTGAIDGTSAANQSVKSNAVNGINLQPGQELWLRWFMPSLYPSPGLAVDDLSVAFSLVPPAASFTGAPTSGTEPLTVTFTDSSTGTITNRFWNFGDGSTSNNAGTTVQHTYTNGTYNVTLVASGPGGSSTNSRLNYVTVSIAPPVAAFSGSPNTGTEPLAVTFTDSSTGAITNRFWNFGDGSVTNTTNTTLIHSYSNGIYSVTLAVSGPGGANTNSQPNYVTAWTTFQSWQVFYFGSTTNPLASATADPDGDGQNNMTEFLTGTDPTNSASYFHIIGATREGNDVRVTWMTGSGRTNAIQKFSDPSGTGIGTNFSDVFNIITTGTITNYLDAGAATNGTAGYYRVRLVR